MANPKTWGVLKGELSETFRKWRVFDWVLVPEKNPTPRAKAYTPDERLVAVRFRLSGKWIGLGCSSELYACGNLQLLVVAIESMRMNDVRGVDRLIAGGYRLLYPPPAPAPQPAEPKAIDERDPYAVLGVPASYPLAAIEKIWKAHLLAVHPDAGGNEEQAKRLNVAMDEIRRRRA